MNQLLNKLERRFGRFAIPDLIKYVVAIYCAGAVLGMVNSDIYYKYLCLDMDAVFHGQVWRLVTFLIEPYGFSSGMGLILSVIFFLFQVNLFFLFGRSLEQAWGTFRFNMYVFSGFLFNIIAALILYVSPLHATIYNSGMQYIYWSMFFAFALLNPDMEFMLYMILPVKVKWLAILDAALMLYQIVEYMKNGISIMMQYGSFGSSYAGMYFSGAIAIIVAMANFLLYFFASRNYRRIHPRQARRQREFRRQTTDYRQGDIARHRCAICGRTELDSPYLDFRYCTRCEGNFEYCSDHLFTHEHVRR